MTDVVMGRRKMWVIGIYSGKGGQFLIVRVGEKCRRVNLQVLQNSRQIFPSELLSKGIKFKVKSIVG